MPHAPDALELWWVDVPSCPGSPPQPHIVRFSPVGETLTLAHMGLTLVGVGFTHEGAADDLIARLSHYGNRAIERAPLAAPEVPHG